MTSQEQGQLRNDAEAVVKSAAWLARRAELLLANIRDGRVDTIASDAIAGMIEAKGIEAGFAAIARKAGSDLPEQTEAGQ